MPPTDDLYDDLRPDDARMPDRGRVVPARGVDRRDDDRRHALRLPPRTYALSMRDIDTLRTVGIFRAVRARDLHETRHSSPYGLERLHAQRLLESRRLHGDVYVALTRDAQRVVRACDPQTVTYGGFVKARELRHDGALYRMYQAHAHVLSRAGATIERIRVDHELKALIYRAPDRHAQAHTLGLPYDSATGRMQFPDLQREYRTASGVRERVNLELTTEHYRDGAVRTKALAGFVLYHLGVGGGAGTAHRQPTGTGGRHRHRDLELYGL
ncbi:MAG: hypothetical protein ACRD2X_10445 [Vicinamibacteraceae bacterium]